MGYLKVDAAGAKQIASDLKSNAEARLGDLQSLGSRARPDAVWEGQAARAYEQRYEAWRNAEQKLVDALRELGQAVDQIVDNFNELDSRGAAAFSG